MEAPVCCLLSLLPHNFLHRTHNRVLCVLSLERQAGAFYAVTLTCELATVMQSRCSRVGAAKRHPRCRACLSARQSGPNLSCSLGCSYSTGGEEKQVERVVPWVLHHLG